MLKVGLVSEVSVPTYRGTDRLLTIEWYQFIIFNRNENIIMKIIINISATFFTFKMFITKHTYYNLFIKVVQEKQQQLKKYFVSTRSS